MSNAAAAGLDICCNTARQANFSPSCLLLQSRFWIRWVDNRLQNKALSHIYALGITRNKNTLHFFWWQTKVSKCSQPWLHGILDELKVLKREEQILIGSDSISFGFSFFGSFLLLETSYQQFVCIASHGLIVLYNRSIITISPPAAFDLPWGLLTPSSENRRERFIWDVHAQRKMYYLSLNSS